MRETAIGFILIALCAGLSLAQWKGLDCAVNEAIGLVDPNNVYSCFPNQTCCTKNLLPACCSPMPADQVTSQQITLWGTVVVAVILLGLFIWFCRSDQSLLDAETPCLHKFCCCMGFKKRGDDGHLHDGSGIPGSNFGSQVSLQSKSTILAMPGDDVPQELIVNSQEEEVANLEAVLEPEPEEEQTDVLINLGEEEETVQEEALEDVNPEEDQPQNGHGEEEAGDNEETETAPEQSDD